VSGLRAGAGYLALGLMALWPAHALAHSAAVGAGLLAGMVHPLSGADHLLAMLGVGIVSVRMGGANIWRVPATFVMAMIMGAIAGMHGSLEPLADVGVALSVILLGVAIACLQYERGVAFVFLGISVFGLCHGYAHGAEFPPVAIPLFYVTGFILSTIFVHVCGIFVGELAAGKRWRGMVLRGFGWIMVIAGAGFALGS
jgi:urease accessory protein